jgi:hypothetical protein
VAKLAGTRAALWVFISLNLNIGNVDCLPFEHDTSGDKPTDYLQTGVLGYRSMVADKVQKANIHLENRSIISIAQASRICGNLSAHALQVRRRTGERRQDPRCGGLLLPSLGQLSGLAFEIAFQLVDQATKVLISTCYRHFGWHGRTIL